MADDVENIKFEDVEDIRELPPGKYAGVIAQAKWDKGQDGKQFVTFAFTPQSPMSEQDLQGVKLGRQVFSNRLYLTNESAPFFKREMKKLGDFPGLTLKDIPEEVVGTEVNFVVEVKEGKNGKEYRNVTDWAAAE